MALQKQAVNINFSQGLDLKTDPNQVPLGKFLAFDNIVFVKGKRLTKRNGFGQLASLPDTNSKFATTFNGNLTAIGDSLRAYSQGQEEWIDKGDIKPVELSTLALIRSNTNQSQVDSIIAPNGLVCTVFTDNVPVGLSNVPVYKYAIADSMTGQNIVPPVAIPVTTGTVMGSPRVFLLGRYFIIVFNNFFLGVNHLQYISVDYSIPTNVTANSNISSQYTPSPRLNFDGYVVNNSLYLAWNGNDGGGAIRATLIDHTLAQHNTVVFPGFVATIMSVTADSSSGTPVIYASFYDSVSSNGYVLALDQNLLTILAPTLIVAATVVYNMTGVATGAVFTSFYEVSNAYSYDPAVPTNYINTVSVTQAGVVGPTTVVKRSVGLASKSFILNGMVYMLTAYQSPYQPTYFLIDSAGEIIAKLAYTNGGGYLSTGLPGVFIIGNSVTIPYLFKDLIAAVNKNTNVPAGNQVAGVYSQLGINSVTFTFNIDHISTAEIGSNLNISGGFLWAYDGYIPVEQGFFVWPDSIEATWSAAGGTMAAQPDGATNINAYFYQVTYEWADNQGNLFRSAPSIPISVTTTGAGATGSITVNVPTLRLTYKLANPVKIVIYRWSVAQQVYYQVTSILVPVLNDPSVDSIAYIDTQPDANILGNNIIYTNGGVIENISPPANGIMTLFQSRLFLVDSEDQNLLWFSKQVIEATPVEMSDLLTIFVAPTTSAQGFTGPITALSAMDDKLIIFKKNAIYYITGLGPDNTGANNQFSEPIFITSTVGCTNQASIVFMPQGIMFQSDKGIWLLGRDLTTQYIGAEVENYNEFQVKSAINVPNTNQVRFTLSNGLDLMYDYFYGQWGTFSGIPAISSTIYQNLHTYINRFGQVFQETVGKYLDGSNPTLVSLSTSWLNLAGLQGYERAYFFELLGTYYSPHKLSIQVAYEYNPAPSQQTVIRPTNFAPVYGQDINYGSGTPYGGEPVLEQWQVFFQRQTCQSFQITIKEIYDATFGVQAGVGLTLSGINCVVGLKKGYRPIAARNSAG